MNLTINKLLLMHMQMRCWTYSSCRCDVKGFGGGCSGSAHISSFACCCVTCEITVPTCLATALLPVLIPPIYCLSNSGVLLSHSEPSVLFILAVCFIFTGSRSLQKKTCFPWRDGRVVAFRQ